MAMEGPRGAIHLGLALLLTLGVGRAEAQQARRTRITGDFTTQYRSDAPTNAPVSSTWENRFHASLVHPLTSGIEAGGIVYGVTRKTTNLTGLFEGERTAAAPYVNLIQSGNAWRATGRASRNPSLGFNRSSPASELLEFNLGMTPRRLPTLQLRVNENRNFDSFDRARLNQRSREIFSTARYAWNILSLEYQHQRNTFDDHNVSSPGRVNITEGLSLTTAREFRPTGYLGLSMAFNSYNARAEVNDLTTSQARSSQGSVALRYNPHSRFQFTESVSGRMSEDKLTKWTTEDLAFTSTVRHQLLRGLDWSLRNVISTHNRRSPLSALNKRTDLSATAKPWTPVTLTVTAFQEDGTSGGSRRRDAEGLSSNIFARVYPELDAQFLWNHSQDHITPTSTGEDISLRLTSRHYRSTDLTAGMQRSAHFGAPSWGLYSFGSTTYIRERTLRVTTQTDYRSDWPAKANSQIQLHWTPRNILFVTVGGNWEHQLSRDLFTLPATIAWRSRPTRQLVGTIEYSNKDLLEGEDAVRLELSSSGASNSSMNMSYRGSRPRAGEITHSFNVSVRKWF